MNFFYLLPYDINRKNVFFSEIFVCFVRFANILLETSHYHTLSQPKYSKPKTIKILYKKAKKMLTMFVSLK